MCMYVDDVRAREGEGAAGRRSSERASERGYDTGGRKGRREEEEVVGGDGLRKRGEGVIRIFMRVGSGRASERETS